MDQNIVEELNGTLQVRNAPLRNRIHISNIPKKSKKEEIIEFFEKFGPVFSAKLVKGKDKTSKGYGKVTLNTKEAFEAIISKKDSLYFHGNLLNIEPFLSGEHLLEKEKEESLKKIIIFNLKQSITKKDLNEAFLNIGEVTEIVIKEKKKKKAFCIITFSNKEEAERAIKTGEIHHNGNILRIFAYDSEAPKSKSKSSSSKNKKVIPKVEKIDSSGRNRDLIDYRKKDTSSRADSNKILRRRHKKILIRLRDEIKILVFSEFIYKEDMLKYNKSQRVNPSSLKL